MAKKKKKLPPKPVQRLRRGRVYNTNKTLYRVIQIKSGTKEQIVRKFFRYVDQNCLRHQTYNNKIKVDKKIARICFPHLRAGQYMRAYYLHKYLRRHLT